jgi:hypothetical protein
LEQLADPATVFSSHELPAPYRTTSGLETLNASFSLATKVQPAADAVAGAGAAGVGADATGPSTAFAVLTSALLASPPPQPANRTATEQKSKCTGFN